MKDAVDLLDNRNHKENTPFLVILARLFIFLICLLVCFILKKSYQRSFDHYIKENLPEQYFLERYLTKFM